MSSEDEILRTLTRMADAIESMTGGFSSATDATRNFTEGMTEAAKSEAEGKKVLDAADKRLTAATNEAIRSVASFGKALTSGTDPSFNKFSDGVTYAAGSAATLAKGFGVLGTVVAGMVQVSAKLLTLQMKQADDVLEASDNIKKLGFAGFESTKSIFDMINAAGLSVAQSKKFTDAMKRTEGGLVSFGDNFGKGAEKFGKMVEVSDQQREAFQRLGVSQEELMGYQGDYLALQKASGQSMAGQLRDTDKLKVSSLSYVENLVKLSALTGKDIDKVKQAQFAANEAFEELVYTRSENVKIRELKAQGLNDQAKAIQDQQDARKQFNTKAYAQFGEQTGSQLARLARTGAYDKYTSGLANLGIEAQNLSTDIKKSKPGDEIDHLFNKTAAGISDSVDRVSSDLRDSFQYGGEELGKQFGINTNLLKEQAAATGVTVEQLDDANKKIKNAIGDPTKGTTGKKLSEDPAEQARNLLTRTTKDLSTGFDRLLFKSNILTSGLNWTTGSVAALGLAAVATAGVLTTIGLLRGGGKVLGALGGMFGRGASAAAGTAAAGTATAAAGTATSVAGTAAKPGFLMSATDKIAERFGTATKGAEAASEIASKGTGIAGSKSLASAAAKSLSKIAAPLSAIVSVAEGLDTAASGIKDANKELTEGNISQKEATLRKSGAIGAGTGQAAGGIGGAVAGAALGTAIFPVVGTAIGAALGGWLGSKGGKEIGGSIGEIVGDSLSTDLNKNKDDVSKVEVVNKNTSPVPISIVKGLAELGKVITSSAVPVKPAPAAPAAAAPAASAAPTTAAAAPANTRRDGASERQRQAASLPGPKAPQGGSGRGGQGGPGVPPPAPIRSVNRGPGGGGRGSQGMAEAAAASSKSENANDLLSFKGPSGTESSFNSLDQGLRSKVLAAAAEYNSVNGGKLQINSAFRSPDDQQRLWDETVKLGTPGRGPQGRPVAKPGSSRHESGFAVDIDNYRDAKAVEALNKQGLFQTVPGDAVHFEKARTGGVFSGSTNGYGVELHGREAVVPLPDPSAKIKIETPDKDPLSTVLNNTTNTADSNSITGSNGMLTDLFDMMEEKFDTMISKLSDSNDTQSKLLMYSRV